MSLNRAQPIQFWIGESNYYNVVDRIVSGLKRMVGFIEADKTSPFKESHVRRPVVLLTGTVKYKKKLWHVWTYEDYLPNGCWTTGEPPDCFVEN